MDHEIIIIAFCSVAIGCLAGCLISHFAFRTGVLCGYAATYWHDDPAWSKERKIINDSRAKFGLKPIGKAA